MPFTYNEESITKGVRQKIDEARRSIRIPISVETAKRLYVALMIREENGIYPNEERTEAIAKLARMLRNNRVDPIELWENNREEGMR